MSELLETILGLDKANLDITGRIPLGERSHIDQEIVDAYEKLKKSKKHKTQSEDDIFQDAAKEFKDKWHLTQKYIDDLAGNYLHAEKNYKHSAKERKAAQASRTTADAEYAASEENYQNRTSLKHKESDVRGTGNPIDPVTGDEIQAAADEQDRQGQMHITNGANANADAERHDSSAESAESAERSTNSHHTSHKASRDNMFEEPAEDTSETTSESETTDPETSETAGPEAAEGSSDGKTDKEETKPTTPISINASVTSGKMIDLKKVEADVEGLQTAEGDIIDPKTFIKSMETIIQDMNDALSGK